MSYASTHAIRAPAVAGLFYPDDPLHLRKVVTDLLSHAHVPPLPAIPKAFIVPHAGYPYSGPVAACAYKIIESLRDVIRKVVIIGPSHRVYLQGIALPCAQAFATPLGVVALEESGKQLLQLDVIASDAPHEEEHCLEVQLPFLQTVLADFTLLPLVVGSASPTHVADVLNEVWGDADTLILASSDLSHYHDYAAARAIDSVTAHAILARHTDLTHTQACGATGLNGLLELARRKGLQVTEIARCNSGDTAGDKNRVVGYGAYALS